MADATWDEIKGNPSERCWEATINTTDVKTEVLSKENGGLHLNCKEIKIQVNIGSGETAIQLQGSVKPNAVESDVQPLIGATAISADWDDMIDGGIGGLQLTGALTTNDTVVTVTQVF